MNAIASRAQIARIDPDAGVLMVVIASAGAASAVGPNPTLGFITQMWVLGSIAGTGLALLRYRRHPEDPRWGLFVAAGAFTGSVAGLVIAALDAMLG